MRSITPAGRDARYNPMAMFLHWIMAVLILLTWALPQIRDFLPRESVPLVIGLHRSLGVTVLALVLLRATWRLISPPPALPGGTTQFVRFSAHAGHAALYLLMLAVPVLGILFTWASGKTISVWSVLELSPPAWIDPDLRDTFRAAHEICANAILWLVGFHAAAALVHHYVFKDGLIDRMLPARLRTRQRHKALI